MNRKLIVPIAASALLLFALADFARAGGLFVSEFGTPTLGTAGAGAPAGTDGASTAIHNPAAMTRLDEHQLAVFRAVSRGEDMKASAWRFFNVLYDMQLWNQPCHYGQLMWGFDMATGPDRTEIAVLEQRGGELHRVVNIESPSYWRKAHTK